MTMFVVLWDTDQCFVVFLFFLPCTSYAKKSVSRKISESQENDDSANVRQNFLAAAVESPMLVLSQMSMEFNSLMRLPGRQQA